MPSIESRAKTVSALPLITRLGLSAWRCSIERLAVQQLCAGNNSTVDRPRSTLPRMSNGSRVCPSWPGRLRATQPPQCRGPLLGHRKIERPNDIASNPTDDRCAKTSGSEALHASVGRKLNWDRPKRTDKIRPADEFTANPTATTDRTVLRVSSVTTTFRVLSLTGAARASNRTLRIFYFDEQTVGQLRLT